MSKKQIKEQHKENVEILKTQNRNEELKELKNKVSDLLEAYSRNDKMRNIYNLIADEKYMEAFETIEEIRNGIKLSKNNLEKAKIQNNLETKMKINDNSILEYNAKIEKIIEDYMIQTKQYIILKKSIYDFEFKEQKSKINKIGG